MRPEFHHFAQEKMFRTLSSGFPGVLLVLAIWFTALNPSIAQERMTEVKAKGPSVSIQYDLVYGLSDEPMHRADLYSPVRAQKSERLPGVILIHGGAWTLGDKTNDTLHAKRLAELGMIVVAINYRLAPKHAFPSQLEDCYLAQEWLCRQADEFGVDTDRLGVWGYSAGGHLAALMATKPKADLPRIKACVAGGAPCDLTLIPERSQLLVGFLGGTREEVPEHYRNASPVTFVSPDDPPFFLFHGTKDRLVPPRSTELMADALQKAKVPFEEAKVLEKAHLMTFLDKETTEKSFLFLKNRLGRPESQAGR
jgi:triacylglycerol lipase